MKNFSFPDTDDKPMWDIWMSIYHLSIISVADELNLFASIGSNKLDLEQLSCHLTLPRRSIEILAEPLTSLGFLCKENNFYYLTKTAQTYLIPESPFYWGAILENQRNKEEHKKILDAIKSRTDQLLHGNKTFTDIWKEGSITPEAARHFTKKMHATIFAPAVNAIESELFESTNKLLDVGGGSGCFSIAYIKKYPERQATVFELPMVCEIAKEYINEYDLSNKITTYAGDFFNQEKWPNGYDAVLLSQILHDWPIEQCKDILTNAYLMLPAKGKIYIHEMLLSDEFSPLTVACFDLLMFINHKSQQFDKQQLLYLLNGVGFKNITVTKTFGYYSLIVAEK